MALLVLSLPSSAAKLCSATILSCPRRTPLRCCASGPISSPRSRSPAPCSFSTSRPVFFKGSGSSGKTPRRSSTLAVGLDRLTNARAAVDQASAAATSPGTDADQTTLLDAREEAFVPRESPRGRDWNPKEKAGRRYLLGLSEDDLIKLSMNLGEQKYRGRQIHQLVYRAKAKHVEDFLHVPQRMRAALIAEGWQVGRSVIHHIARSSDGTVKVLLRLEDNRLVETVGIPVYNHVGKIDRLTACVSSQVGCALKCAFCATGKGGFARNLKAHEIIEQVLVIDELFKSRVSNVVFMGMGEPLMNLPALVPAIQALNKEVLIGQRMMTVSTVGVPNTIARLAALKLQITLAISLHAPNQRLRCQIVPSAKGYPLESLLTDCRSYFHETGRRVSIEYTLLSGINDQQEHAEELANLLHHWKLGRHVNVIPYNPVADAEFRRPNRAQVMAFVSALNNRRVTTSIRQTRGLDANAACGQLRNDFQKFAISDVPQGVPT